MDDRQSFNSMLNETGSVKLLSSKEEAELAMRIKNGDDRALNKLVAHNITYVVSVANQYKNRGMDIDDLISEGSIGLVKAARKFDPQHGRRFVTFAAPYVRDAMEKAILQHSGIYRVPRDADNVSLERHRSQPLSIDAPVGGSPELSLGRVISDVNAPDPDKQLQHVDEGKELQSLVSKLEPRERYVLQRFFGIGMDTRTMSEIGKEMGLKRERVRQIRDKAVRHILKLSDNAHLKDFLRN